MESSEIKGMKEMGSPKITVPDHHHHHHHHHTNGLSNENGVNKSDTFVVDLNNFSNGVDKDSITNAANSINSRITLQRSLTRKVPQRGTERNVNNGDTLTPSSSPRAGQVVSMPEKPLLPSTLQVGSTDHPKPNQFQHQQHQITIKTGGVSSITADGRWSNNRSSFKRSPPSWFSDPKRILLFFATLSCMGTILLIFFTLSMKNPTEKDDVLDWQ